jgi:maltose alpha-D-glucosyltransferase / alpha-amylase
MPLQLETPISALDFSRGDSQFERNPLWYKDAVIYQLHVRAFQDSNADGIGDFAGLTQRLDYLQDLGVTAIWLLPFYPSPLKDDGYDIADYLNVNRSYGTLKDVKAFLREAHARGLRVITELVLNHTSDQHPWFQRARRAPAGSPERDFYVWSDTPEKYRETRIIFKDFEPSNWSWDPLAKAYYWHRFYSHQPDLNWDNPEVHNAMLKVLDYWLGLGVDGLRLDAVPYLIEREDTNCENLPETHQILKEVRKHIDGNFQDKMLLAEANQWPEDAIAYFGNGDECHAAFHFPVMPRMFMAIQMEDRFPIIDILQQTPDIPGQCQWFVFLRNHDELTLEMVTDEERDYMYRMYARDRQARINLGIRRRLAPLMGNNRRKIELMNGLLFALPGTPVIYYGDEIGMGDNIYLGDRDGVRTPMQWSSDRNAGFSRAHSQQLFLPVIIDSEFAYQSVNVETQRNNPQSLWWWMKRLINFWQHYPALTRGTIEMLAPENNKVLAFLRKHEDQAVLVVANLSRFTQFVELDLSTYEGQTPLEIFGRNRFPTIGRLPYLLTLGPHTFYWFSMNIPPADSQSGDGIAASELKRFRVHEAWSELLRGRGKAQLEQSLQSWLQSRRWFGGKARTVQNVVISDSIPLVIDHAPHATRLVLFRVEYVEGEPDNYTIPIGYAPGELGEQMIAQSPQNVLARLHVLGSKEDGVLYEAVGDSAFAARIFDLLTKQESLVGGTGELSGHSTPALETMLANCEGCATALVRNLDSSNTVMTFADRLFFKMFRKIEPGVNPDLEIGRYLTNMHFGNTPATLGWLEYGREGEEKLTIGILQEAVHNTTSAWQATLDNLGRYFEQLMAQPQPNWKHEMPVPGDSMWKLAHGNAPPLAKETLNLDQATLLGRRTGEMHAALAANTDDPDFAPEPFGQLYQRSLYQSMRKQTVQNLQLLRRRLAGLPEATRPLAQSVLEQEKMLLESLGALLTKKLRAQRLRCHGDYHLGQVLYTGKDFMIIDFEGEPARSISERRLKQSPLKDVAGMLRSYHYAASYEFFQLKATGLATADNIEMLERAANFWCLWSSSAFLKGYLSVDATAAFLPPQGEPAEILMDAYLIEKAVYELGYELNNRPDWVEVPLRGILNLLPDSTAHV